MAKINYFILLSLLLVGCFSKQQDNQNVFLYNESNGITSLDPAFARDLEIMWATNQLFDGLVELNDSMQIVPLIAKAWQVSDDKKTYTFTLRNDVYFHDSEVFQNGKGRLLIAQDIAYSLNRLKDPTTASPGKWILDKVQSIEVSNDSTIAFVLSEKFEPFLGLLCTQYANVVPHEAIEKYGSEFRNHPVGTGPFQFAFWYENIALVFHKNKNYFQFDEHGNRLPYLDAVKIDFAKDMSAEYQGLIQGKYDFMSGVHNAFKDELLDPNGNLSSAYSASIYLQKTPFIKTDYLGFVVDPSLQANKALLDKRVRQALNLAINKNEMVKHLRNNTVIPGNNGFCSPAVGFEINEQVRYSYNLSKAKELLVEAGYADGKGIPTIVVSTTSDYTDLIEYIQHAWQAIGVTCEVQQLQGSAFRESAAKCQLAVFRKSWLADYTHPENFYSVFSTNYFTPNGPNYTHFTSKMYDQQYNAIGNTSNPDSLLQLANQLETMLSDEMPVIPLYYDQVMHFIRKEISNFPTNATNMLDLRRVKKS